MKITSAKFVRGIVADDGILGDGVPQYAFIGRSNVGKSSLINSFTRQKDLARTSSFPGRTQQINLFLINNSFYLVDLPGYGFAKLSLEDRAKLQDLIYTYFFSSDYTQKKVVLIIDAEIGFTESDLVMLQELEEHHKDIIIVANKIDKVKKSQLKMQIQKIANASMGHPVIPYSSVAKLGMGELAKAMFG